MAKPSARVDVSRRVLRCPPRQDSRRGDGPQQGRLSCAGAVTRWRRDILGIWIEQTEGAKFWMKVFTDLKTRGCQDILIAVTEGLKGMSEAPAAIYPATTLQTCIVHLLRHSLDFANGKERKPLAAALDVIERGP